jgi:DNA-binding transcriptional LysR family regulator
MELFQLRYFAAAARSGNFSRAAEEVCVSQPSLSLQIANLEREVGAPLFTRHGRSVRLTDAGQALREHAERILESEAEARRAVRAVVGLERGRLSLWTLPTLGQHLLPPALAAFRRAHPGIEISVREAVPARAVAEAVAAGRADLGFLHLPSPRSGPPLPGLAQRILLTEELALVVPVDHQLAHTEHAVALADVAGEDFVWVPEGSTRSTRSSPPASPPASRHASPVCRDRPRACRRWSRPGWGSRCCPGSPSIRPTAPWSWTSCRPPDPDAGGRVARRGTQSRRAGVSGTDRRRRMNDTPWAEYRRRHATRQADRDALARRDDAIGNARLAVFLIGVAVAWAIWGRGLLAAGWIAPPTLAFLGLVIATGQVRARRRRRERPWRSTRPACAASKTAGRERAATAHAFSTRSIRTPPISMRSAPVRCSSGCARRGPTPGSAAWPTGYGRRRPCRSSASVRPRSPS